jgi:Ribosomal protein L6P/L9E
MSRIGNKPIEIPEKVELKIDRNLITIKGPKGELTVEIVDDRINFEINEKNLNFSRSSEVSEVRSLHGLYRSLIANNIQRCF